MSPDRGVRGHAISERRKALGVFEITDFARRTGKSRNTIRAAEEGRASESTYLELEAWLDVESARQNAGLVSRGEDVDRIEFDISGPSTEWRFTVSGPIEEAEQVRLQARELMRDLMSSAAPENAEKAPEPDV
jgi:hypothetical protein